MKLSNWKILYKILACFALLSVIVAGGVWFATSRMQAIDQLYTGILEKDVRGVQAGMRANQRVFNFGRLTWRMVAETETSMIKKMSEEIAANQKEFTANIETAKKLLPSMAARFDQASQLFADIYATSYPPLEKATTAGDNVEALRMSYAMAARTSELRQRMVEITTDMDKDIQTRSDAATVQVVQTVTLTVVMIGGGFLAALVLAFAIVQFGISRPMGLLVGSLNRLAKGEEIEITGTERGDEVGETAKAVNAIKVMLAAKARQEAEAKIKQDQAAAVQRKADMIKLADDFEGAVGEIIETVSSASTELEASAGTLTSTAERAQELTTMVAAASEEASTNVQSVASATEELTSSVNEISRQVQESARMANDAVGQARTTNDRVSELSKAAARIGDVVELINTIAGQTNLLALNATIEAARAGEAGRGFAVVASEVKALAEQTAKATGEIGQQISGIQAATQESVTAIKEISGTIVRLSEISSTIAAAVEEQGAATQEISRNVQQAAQGTQQVSSNITDVQRGASETGSASSQVLSAAQSLSGDSNRLKLEVGKFLSSVRAA
ncbi:MAG TPA: methyl-accepting chemotaxis protein [Bradyrhizobium sp.]|jgi:methyl-accepting chemotaxis protein|nr:methyl-accepting chemotaxis protein [Bradyrhizobium sp.]